MKNATQENECRKHTKNKTRIKTTQNISKHKEPQKQSLKKKKHENKKHENKQHDNKKINKTNHERKKKHEQKKLNTKLELKKTKHEHVQEIYALFHVLRCCIFLCVPVLAACVYVYSSLEGDLAC